MTAKPDDFLPLTPVAFELLLSLAGGERHGYAILRDIGARLGGQPNAGTLYRAIARLVDAGVMEEEGGEGPVGEGDGRRRNYRLTKLGRAVLTAEAKRLERAVAAARARAVLPGTA